MKNHLQVLATLALLPLVLLPSSTLAGTISKADNNTALSATGSWTGGVVPGSGDIACFAASGCTAFTAGRTPSCNTAQSWLGITAGSGMAGNVTIGFAA